MDRDTFDRLPPGTVLTSTSACPVCRQRGQVEITIVLARTTGSLSGTQMKFPARKSATFECGHCGAMGEAAPKD